MQGMDIEEAKIPKRDLCSLEKPSADPVMLAV
jgi:hypothetical protein